ncbi:hypothetical protein FISHEDRAFT_58165 [Fistulina hepatica ATCC 64428]|nr:hypothetical protein FISHEDRAFT_58165 [Fistulina hepatica ATCC 64428]
MTTIQERTRAATNGGALFAFEDSSFNMADFADFNLDLATLSDQSTASPRTSHSPPTTISDSTSVEDIPTPIGPVPVLPLAPFLASSWGTRPVQYVGRGTPVDRSRRNEWGSMSTEADETGRLRSVSMDSGYSHPRPSTSSVPGHVSSDASSMTRSMRSFAEPIKLDLDDVESLSADWSTLLDDVFGSIEAPSSDTLSVIDRSLTPVEDQPISQSMRRPTFIVRTNSDSQFIEDLHHEDRLDADGDDEWSEDPCIPSYHETPNSNHETDSPEADIRQIDIPEMDTPELDTREVYSPESWLSYRFLASRAAQVILEQQRKVFSCVVAAGKAWNQKSMSVIVDTGSCL